MSVQNPAQNIRDWFIHVGPCNQNTEDACNISLTFDTWTCTFAKRHNQVSGGRGKPAQNWRFAGCDSNLAVRFSKAGN